MSSLSQLELEACERQVDETPTDDFVDLVRVAGLDPKKHLRFADWSGVDFSGCDLRGFDFTGARLIGCKFKDARIEGARFDQALIDEVRPCAKLDPNRTNLRAAEDWEKYAKSWSRLVTPAPVHLPPGSVFQDAPFAPEMVVVPPGRFWMGSKDGKGFDSERPQHKVTIPQAFAIGRFPVTFHEWDTARAAGIVQPKPPGEGWGRGRHPVVQVSWDDAQAYVQWLSNKTGKAYRLLSEAEWEYACRAGTETALPCDRLSEAQAQLAAGSRDNVTVEVGSFPANGFGVYDMLMNVWEWCEDRRQDSYRAKSEDLKQTGKAWTTEDSRGCVLRGGSLYRSPDIVRAERRSNASTWLQFPDVGFRVARTLYKCAASRRRRRRGSRGGRKHRSATSP